MDVIQNEAAKQFEVLLEGKRSVLDYVLDGNTMIFTHTGVPRELEGRGIAGALAKAALEFARERNFQVVPACSFIRVYIQRHPEFQNLLAPA